MNTNDLSAVLGPLAPLYANPEVGEIVVDAPDRVSVFGASAGPSEVKFETVEALREVIDHLMALGGVTLNSENTSGEVRLPDDSRVAAVIPPTAVGSPYLFIKKVDREQFTNFTWEMLLEGGNVSAEAHELLMSALPLRGLCTNLLVVGDYNSRHAKTYILNLLAESAPPEERVIVVANTPLLPVARHPRCIHLEPGSAPQNSTRRLLEIASHMHADHLVTGDLQGPEVMTLIHLMNSGQHVLTTLVAQSPLEALTRIEAMYLMSNPGLRLAEIRPLIAAAIPLIPFMKLALPNFRFKLTQLVEVCGVENDRYVLQPLFTYDNEQGTLHLTEAGKTWPERTRSRIITG